MEFHRAVGNHETQAGRQLGSEELLLRESLNDGLLKASLSYTYMWSGMGRIREKKGP
jgi:hypothetical protein